MAGTPLAVVDLGSNSARLVVFAVGERRSFEVVADEHAPLRLIRELDPSGRLRPAAIERALHLLRDFRAVATGAGAPRIAAVATAALREAANSGELIERARAEAGIDVRILDTGAEARAAFLGAVYSLPLRHGLVVDIGGGSVQVAHFRNRGLLRHWSLPLGALRISDAFLASDPPAHTEIQELREHLHRSFALAGLPRLAPDEGMIGTGGTIRNLAKVDGRRRDYPIPPLHGYELTRTRLRDLSALLAGRKRRSRALLPGLNTERADSIVGGAIAAECILERGGAGRITVAGLGLREGIVLDALGLGLPPPADVRRIALATLCRRFTPCAAGHEGRRVRLARALYRLLEPERDAIVEEMLEHAAACLDIGRSIDYYRRHQHTAAILRASGLFGFRHREIAKLAAIVELSDINGWNLKHYRPLLRKADQPGLARAGLVLALADQLDHRLPPGAEARIRGRMRADACLLFEPALAPWDAPRFRARFQQAFGRELRLAPERGRRSRDRKRSGAERPS